MMASHRGVFRLFAVALAAGAVCLFSVVNLRADDDDQVRPKRHKTLQERILEVQAGRGILDAAANRPQTFTGPDLTDREKVVQVLNRMTFGPKPGEVDDVLARGYPAWIKEQLDPEKIDDSECEKAVSARFPWLKMSMTDMENEYGYQKGDKKKRENEDSIHAMLPQLVMTRAVSSKRQFKEIMCEFWRNHFAVDQPAIGDEKTRTFTDADYEETVIRKYAFGYFKDMLYASARHPAMLEYLDNKLSRKGEWNENYAREVMELHTLGADRGYSNRDVQELAKILTGWQYDDEFHFRFKAGAHQPGPKIWLGMQINEGYEGGELALYTLAMHHNTSEFISEKLCRYLVNDNPSPFLVKKVASVFRDTKGNLPKVYAAILSSPDFLSRENYRAKFKMPFYFTVSALRAVSARYDRLYDVTQRVAKMGQPIYNCPDPTGYRDQAESWMDAGVLTSRWQFSWDLMRGDIGSVKVGNAFFSRYKDMKPDDAEAKMLEDLIGGDVGDRELAALKDAQSDPSKMASIILGSPSFQQR